MSNTVEDGVAVPRSAMSPADIRSVFVGIMLAMLLSALDQTIVATALPTIGRDLGDVDHLPWIVTAYLLASTAVTPLYGKFSDMHGRRVTMLIGIGVFLAGSVACALSTSMLALVLSRALQGFGGGGLIALAQTIVADMVTPRERGRYQVYFGAVFGAASLGGPILGGLFSEHLHWSVIFWINLPLGLLALGLVNSRLKRLPQNHRRHRLDVLGAILITCATVSLMLALSSGGASAPWLSVQVLGLVGTSLCFWGAFIRRQMTASEPLIPLAILRDRVVWASTLASALGMGTFIGLSIFTPIFFESARGMTAQQSGTALIPFMACMVAGSTASGRAMATLLHYKRVPLVGMCIATTSLALVTLGVPSWPTPILIACLAFTSLGLGTLMPVMTVCLQNAVLPTQLGTATAGMNFSRQLSGAMVVALYGAIALGGRGAGHGITLETLSLGGGAEMAGVFRWVFGAATVGLLASLVVFISMEERPLRDQRLGPAEMPAE